MITENDNEKLFQFFESSMKSANPDPKILQQMCIFNIIHYMGRRGRENLRNMQKDTFEIKQGTFVSGAPDSVVKIRNFFGKKAQHAIYVWLSFWTEITFLAINFCSEEKMIEQNVIFLAKVQRCWKFQYGGSTNI